MMKYSKSSAAYDSFLEKFSNLEIRFDSMVHDAENINSDSIEIPPHIFPTLSVISESLQKCQKEADRMPSEFDKYSNIIGEDLTESCNEKFISGAYKSLRDFQSALCAAYESYFDVNKKIHEINRDEYRASFLQFEEEMEGLHALCDSIEILLINGRAVLDDAGAVAANESKELDRNLNEWQQIESSLATKLNDLDNRLCSCAVKLDFCKKGRKISAQNLEIVLYLTQRLQAEEIRLRRLATKTNERLLRLQYLDTGHLADRSTKSEVKSSDSIPSYASSKTSASGSSHAFQADLSAFSFASGSSGLDSISKVKVWKEDDEAADRFENGDGSVDLPEGWREVVDKRSARSFYVNQITKEKQWKRPLSARSVSSTLTTKSRDFTSTTHSLSLNQSVSISENSSYRGGQSLSASSRVRQKSIVSEDADGNSKQTRLSKESQNTKLQKKIEKARKATLRTLQQVEERAASDSGHQGRVSVAYFDKIGMQEKCGYLMKQTKLLQRWRRRFVVLRETVLLYFDSEKDYQKWTAASGSVEQRIAQGKAVQLSESISVAYTSIPNCFCISDPGQAASGRRSAPAVDWFFLADSTLELEGWITAVNAHIHIKYKQDHSITGDYWEEKTSQVYPSFWRMPSAVMAGADSSSISSNASSMMLTLKRPLGIRSVPAVDGPRTGEGVFPCEVIEVVQVIPDMETGQVFLRLAYDRGWVMTRHPSGKYSVLCELKGDYVEEKAAYSYSADFSEDLNIFCSPNCSTLAESGRCYEPGAVFSTCAKWSPAVTEEDEIADDASALEGGVGVKSPNVFLKLSDKEGVDGWVAMFHPSTGEPLLTKVS